MAGTLLWAGPGPASAASRIDPDEFVCSEPGYVSFEEYDDRMELRTAITPGIEFTNTGGLPWIAGNFETGNYNGKYPSGAYTSEGFGWAWLGPNQGEGRVTFTEGEASSVSLLVSAGTNVVLKAYDDSDALLEATQPTTVNTGTGLMDLLEVNRLGNDIAYVVVHDSANFFLVDALCTDAPGVPNADACDGASPIVCYAPEVRFHPDEDFYPMEPDDFIRGSELKFAQNGNCFRDTVVAEQVDPADIALENFTASTLSTRWLVTCEYDDERYGLQDFTRPFDDDGANQLSERPSTLPSENGFFLKYVEDGIEGNEPTGNRIVAAPIFAQQIPTADGGSFVAYQMFYGYDPKADASLDTEELRASAISIFDGVVAHQGDWERIDVVLDPNDQPTEVRYYGHGCDGDTFEATNFVPWATLEASPPAVGGLVDGTHPVVFSAQGSHASYPGPRDAGESLCPDGGFTDSIKGRSDVTDYVPGESGLWRTWESPSTIVSSAVECWYGYGGAWGSTAPAASSILQLASDATGPAGPYHNLVGATATLPEFCATTLPTIDFFGVTLAAWGQSGTVTVSGFGPGKRIVLNLASIETKLAEATVGPDGSATLTYTVPAGTYPGAHRLIVRDETGRSIGSTVLNIDVPAPCTADLDPVTPDDLDGDALADLCDPATSDGPLGDYDNDGQLNQTDNCSTVANPDQDSIFDRSSGSACDPRTGFNPIETDFAPCDPTKVTIVGTTGDDVIIGTSGDDVIDGGAGNDVIDGGAGNDTICGGDGDDVVDGGNGNDTLHGGGGDDTINGGNGIDLVAGGNGNDTLHGGGGDDFLDGGDGNDTLSGGNGDDSVLGGFGDDEITGDRDERGDDLVVGGPGSDIINGGSGDDRIGADVDDISVTGDKGFDRCLGAAVGSDCESSEW